MTYIHKAVFQMIDADLQKGYPLTNAVVNAAIFWHISSTELLDAYNRKQYRAEMAHRASIAFLMLAVFASPVLFYFVAKG